MKSLRVALTKASLIVLLAVLSACEESTKGGGADVDVPSSVSVDQVYVETSTGLDVFSSTQLTVSWHAAEPGSVDHFVVNASESIGASEVEVSADGDAESATLTDLKSDTEYSVTVTACGDSACSDSAMSSAVTGSTPEEMWQLQGTGNDTSTLTEVVSDGNARLSVARFGADAGPDTANRLQLYYGPMPTDMSQSLAVASTSSDTSASDASSYLSFTSYAGATGLTSTSATASEYLNGSGIGAGVAVPVSSALGGNVMLVFEARGADGFTRIFSISSQDGYTGRDFNAGAGTICSSTADYSTGGDCELDLLIPVATDPGGNAHIANARQMKLGWPSLDDWRWDGAAGLFMVFTVDSDRGTCTSESHNHAYAVWSGSAWEVQYDSSTGCPEMFQGAQAAFPLHLGGVKYKMYYGNPSDMTGSLGTRLPFVGPKTIIYADGANTGDPAVVDFDDWEPQSAARGVSFYWPDGSTLDATEEGYIDDYQAIMPTAETSLQVMYVAISDGSTPPTSAAAILLNP